MRYRVEELAARCGVSVDTIRFYQGKGLLPRPEREGRVAWYGEDHVERLRRIHELKRQGVPLAVIERLLSGELAASDEALAAALATVPRDEQPEGETLTRAQLAERTGVSDTVLEAIEREGLLVPSAEEADGRRYTTGDAEAVEAGVALLEAGVPLGELLDLARRYDEAVRGVAEHAVEVFVRFVRDPVQGAASSEQEASARLVTAFRQMLPAAQSLVAHQFRRLVLSRAQARLQAEGDEGEPAAGRGEARAEWREGE